MANVTLRPLILDEDGIISRLPNNAIINACGVNSPTFTVRGKSVALVDGSSATLGEVGLTLQKIYDETSIHGDATVVLKDGKNLTISRDDNTSALVIDALTGKVTITGDLEVQGATKVVETTITDSDFWIISPSTGTTTALRIEPDAGVTPAVDLVNIRKAFGAPSVFRIDRDGNVITTQNLTVGGQINGVNVTQLKTTVDQHIAGSANKHSASHINVTAIDDLSATTVQAALEALNEKIENTATVSGYEHTQDDAEKTWTITHGRNTRRVTVAIYDNQWEQVIPGGVKITNENTVTVTFGSAMAGSAMLTIF